MQVKAAEGLKVPREEDPRSYIGEEPVDIEVTGYYVRRLAEGDLVEVASTTARPTAPAGKPAAKAAAAPAPSAS